MTRSPRRATEQILTRDHWTAMASWAGLITTTVHAAFWTALARSGTGDQQAVTVSFLTPAFAQICHVFIMRRHGGRLLRRGIVARRWIWGALAVCTVLVNVAVFLPPLASVLRVEAPSTDGWTPSVGMSVTPAVVGRSVRPWLKPADARA